MSIGSKLLTVLLCSSAAFQSGLAWASDMETVVVDKVIEGYGGKKFETLNSIRVESDLRFGWLGQGHTPDFVELEPMTKIHHFDLKNRRASEEAWGNRGAYSEKIFVDETGQTTLNFIEGTYEKDPEASYYDHFGGEGRTIDTIVALELLKQRETANYLRDEYYRGMPHHVLEFDMPDTSIDPVLWINAKTGHISLMKRSVPDYLVYSYAFEDFRQTKGITYAEDFVLFAGQDIIEYAKSRSILPNRVKASVFEVADGLILAPETLDSSEMTVDQIVPNLFHVGQGGSYGAFFDTGDYLIALGGYSGLEDRYNAYVKTHGAKPLRYLVLTHHHSDHVAGVQDALELGATLVLPASARANVYDAITTDLPDNRIKVLEDKTTTLDGIEIYLTSTPHVQDYALIYVPAAKVIFQEDLYNGNYRTRAARVNETSLILKTEAEKRNLDVGYLLGAHSRKAESWADFLVQAETPVLGACPSNRPICR